MHTYMIYIYICIYIYVYTYIKINIVHLCIHVGTSMVMMNNLFHNQTFGRNLRIAIHLFKQRPCVVRHCYRKVMLYQKVSKQHFSLCYLCVGIGGDKRCHWRRRLNGLLSACAASSRHVCSDRPVRRISRTCFLHKVQKGSKLSILECTMNGHSLVYLTWNCCWYTLPLFVDALSFISDDIDEATHLFDIFPLAFPIWRTRSQAIY